MKTLKLKSKSTGVRQYSVGVAGICIDAWHVLDTVSQLILIPPACWTLCSFFSLASNSQ